MLQSWVTQLGAAAIAVVCIYALAAGTWRERFGAIIYLAAYLLSLGFGLIGVENGPLFLADYLRSEHISLYLLVADMLLLQGLCVIAWKSPHPWPKWALAAQLISIAAHVAVLFDLGLGSRAYLTIATATGWAVLIALLIGTIAAAHARRESRRQSRRMAA
jgi:hypothetical protein